MPRPAHAAEGQLYAAPCPVVVEKHLPRPDGPGEAQLSAPVPNEGIVREAGRTLRAILEGAIAGAISQPGALKAGIEAISAIFGP